MKDNEGFLVCAARQLFWAKMAVRRDLENTGVKVVPSRTSIFCGI